MILQGTGTTVATTGVKTAGAVAAGLISSGSVVIGGAAITAAAVPLIGAAVLGVTLALNYIFNRPTQKYKVITTTIVNDLEPQLKANVAAYMSGPRTLLSQAAALQNFDAAWAYLTSAQGCGSPSLDFPGRNCISDRNRGGKWDWFSYYRDPIANDPTPHQQAAADPLSTITGTLSQPGSSYVPEAILAAVVLAIALN